MDDRLKIIVQTAIDKNSKQNLDDKLSKLKLKPLQLNVTLAKNAASTINSQLKELKIKAFSIPIDVQKKSIKQAVKGITDEMSGGSISKSLDSTLKKINTFRTQLANIEQSSFGLSHPIIDPQNQEKLSIAYKNIDDAINQVAKSGQQMTAQQEINIRKQIADVERLRKAYVQSERGALALEQKPITFDIEKATANLSALEAKWRNQGIYTGQFEENIERIKVALSKVDDQEGISKINQEIGLAKIKAQELNTELRKFNAVTAQSTAQNKVISFLNANPKAIAANKKGFEDLIALIPKITNPAALTAFNKQFAEVISTIDAMQKKGNTLFGSLKANMGKFLSWLLASGGVMSAIATLKNMVSTVISLDKALVNLRMATGYTYKETKQLLEGYNALGQKLGATTLEVAESANDWLRQGKSIEETNMLIENSLILSKVGMIGSAEATQYLTSATRGYNVEARNSLKIIDMLTGIDMKAAVSAGGLAEAMSRTAASASIAGVEMERLLGYLATVGEVSQKEMSSIGESFKTIFSRMRDIKIGADTDEEGESLSNVETVLTDLNIKLRSSVGEFRDFGDVLDDVGTKWKSYNSVQQAAIAKAFSGVRQQENFLILMENYGKALEYNEVALNSAGTATEKMAAYDESLEASLKKLTSAFESLSSTTVNGGFIKGSIDWGTNFLNILTWIIDKFGVLGTAGATALGIITAKSGGRVKTLTLEKYATGSSNGNTNELRVA